MVLSGRTGQDVDVTRTRPHLPQEYGMPQDQEGLLEWAWVEERLNRAKNYWVITARRDGRPHAAPVWAYWIEGTLYLDGHPQTRWARNIAQNPSVCVHLESGDEVVILEGTMEDIARLDRPTAEKIGALSLEKYPSLPADVDELVRRGLFALTPTTVLAWNDFPVSMTKWEFNPKG